VSAKPFKSALAGLADVLRAGLDPCSGPTGCHIGRNARDGLRLRRGSSAFKGVKCSGRIVTRTPPDEFDNLLKLPRPELGRDLADASLMEQQNSCYDCLVHALSGGPPFRFRTKRDSVGIRQAMI
jgi:hypothetical protein